MEYVTKNITIEKELHTIQVAALIDEVIALEDAAKVLYTTGMFFPGKAECMTNAIMLNGIVAIDMVYTSTQMQLQTQRAEFDFNDTFESAGIAPEMFVACKGTVRQTEYTLVQEGLHFSAVLDLALYPYKAMQTPYITPESLLSAQTLPVRLHGYTIAGKTLQSGEFSHEAILPARMQPVEKVLSCAAEISIESVAAGLDVIELKGTVTADIIYATQTENNPLQRVKEVFPVELDWEYDTAIGRDLSAMPIVTQIACEVIPDENGELRILQLDGTSDVLIALYEEVAADALLDAFSVDENWNVSTAEVLLERLPAVKTKEVFLRESVSVLEQTSSPVQALQAMVQPVVTLCENGVVEGIAECVLAYKSATAEIFSTTLSVAFSTSFDMDPAMTHEKAYARVESCYVNAVSATELEMQLQLSITMQYMAADVRQVVSAISVSSEEVALPKGITLYFTAANDTPWSIAKNIKMPVDQLMQLNEDIGQEGVHRVITYRQ